MSIDELQPRSKVLREALDRSKEGKADDQMLLLSLAETCKRLDVSKTKLYELLRNEEIASVKVGRRRKFEISAIRKFIEEHKDKRG